MGIKIGISYQPKMGAWGGGNQFLLALCNQLKKTNNFIDTLHEADVVILNSHHNVDEIVSLKRTTKIPIVHRLDGLPQLYNEATDTRQALAFDANRKLADGTIFQSQWSKTMHIIQGLEPVVSTVIYNACNSDIFRKKDKIPTYKTRLVTTSWSDNPNKGFKYLTYLDKYLDFNKYTFSFIGNSPVNFTNIKKYNPMPSLEIAEHLNISDIFITGTRNDACSNSIIEALTCGLPVIALNSGGSPELVRSGGVLFNNEDDLMSAIDNVSNDILSYRNKIEVPTIEEIAHQYITFCEQVANNV